MSVRFAPSNLVEQAVGELIDQGLEMNPPVPIYVGDTDTVKATMPYITVICSDCVEIISPGCGIFEAIVDILYKSHVKITGSDARDDTLKQIIDLAYGTETLPERLSEKDNFHCYGWVDMGVSMEVSDADKSYTHKVSWKIVFIPRNNE